MPSAQIRVFDVLLKGKKLERLVESSEREIISIIQEIKNRTTFKDFKIQWFKRYYLFKAAIFFWKKNLHNLDKDFRVNDECNHCGVCSIACPMNNISFQNGTGILVWNGNCQDCHGCINVCPKRAIQIKNKTKNKGRYINPNVSIKDLMISKGDNL